MLEYVKELILVSNISSRRKVKSFKKTYLVTQSNAKY